MATSYQWVNAGASFSGCPGTALSGGWYATGSTTPIVSSYTNPSTGKKYTPQELAALSGGGGGTTTTEGGITQPTAETVAADPGATGGIPAGYVEGGGHSVHPEVPSAITAINFPSLSNINVPAPAVSPAPAFELSPEQLAWQESISGYLTETLEQGGRGIPEETMALMTQRTTDTLKAKEAEDIRVMRNNMERRGITNSGFTFANEQKIRSNTTVAIANSITDLNIKNALMKLSSFEMAMGQAAQFLGYLGEMSQLKYQPQYQTWAAQQQANLYQYQAKIDLYKTQLQQAYQQQNLILQNQLTQNLQDDQQAFELQISEMEIEAANQQAAAEGAGNLVGTTIGGIFGML